MKSFIALACLSSLLLVSAPAAQATAVTYAFSVQGVGGTGSGSFVFDDATGATNLFNEVEYVLSDFHFNAVGGPFDLTDLDLSTRRVLFSPGGDLLGLEAFSTGAGFSFLPSVGGSAAFLMTANGSSTVSYRLDPGVVSEPGTALLGLAALGALAAWRRRPSA